MRNICVLTEHEQESIRRRDLTTDQLKLRCGDHRHMNYREAAELERLDDGYFLQLPTGETSHKFFVVKQPYHWVTTAPRSQFCGVGCSYRQMIPLKKAGRGR